MQKKSYPKKKANLCVSCSDSDRTAKCVRLASPVCLSSPNDFQACLSIWFCYWSQIFPLHHSWTKRKKELVAFKAFQSIKHEPFDYSIDSYWKTFQVIRATYESGGKKLFWSRLTWQSRFVAFLYSATADGITLFTSSTSTFRHRIVTSLSISWKRP